MKKLIAAILFIIAFQLCYSQYASQNINLLAIWSNPTITAEPTYGIKYNGIWGWYDEKKNKEYGIIGGSDGVYFVDITVPTSPVLCDFVPGRRDSCIWRELKTYKNYCYMVSDDKAPNSFQIVDLSYLPDSVHVVYDKNNLIERVHALWQDGNKLYCSSPKGPSIQNAQMCVLSLKNPANPVLLRKLSDDNPPIQDGVHDMYVRNDTVFASHGYAGLFIYKFDTVQNKFSLKGSLTSYQNQGYNHSSVMTKNAKTLFFLDEVPVNLPCKSLDISNFSNLTVLQQFTSSAGTIATPHNPFINNNNDRLVVAYYQDGVQIFDISNPSNVKRTGYFDTNPNDGAGLPKPDYSGCWGAYIYFPSGVIIASDMQRGMFILDATAALTHTGYIASKNNHFKIYPNPTADVLQITVDIPSYDKTTVQIKDISGRIVLEKHFDNFASNISIDISEFESGTYLVSFITNKDVFTEMVVKK